MIYRKTEDFDAFSCLAGRCPDTCCGGWDVEIDEKSAAEYSSLNTPLGERIRKSIDWETGCFAQEGGRCVLLDGAGLCEIQKELGGEALCDTCRIFPRHVEEYENVREYSLSLSCPEAAWLLLEKEDKRNFYEYETKEEPEEFEEFDRELYGYLRKARELFLQILQNRNIPVRRRIEIILKRSASLQDCLDEDAVDDMAEIIKDTERVCGGKLPDSLEETEEAQSADYRHKRVEYACFYEMDWLRPQWGELVEAAWNGLFSKGEEEYGRLWEKFHGDAEREERLELMREQLLTAYVDLYVCGAVYDGELFSKAALAVFSTRWIEEFLLFRFSVSEKNFSLLEEASVVTYRFAREVEHSDNNLLLLEDWAKSRIMVQKI